MHHDSGDDLRMFIGDEVRYRTGIHPLQAFDAAGVAVVQDAVEQACGLVIAQCFIQHVADVVAGIHADGGLLGGA
jgi:hypothetical protein